MLVGKNKQITLDKTKEDRELLNQFPVLAKVKGLIFVEM